MPNPTEEIKSKCNICGAWVRQRVTLHIERRQQHVCGACAVLAAVPARLQGQHVAIRSNSHGMLNRWTTGLGGYFSSEADARQQQAWYEARCVRYARQVQRAVAREVLRGMGAIRTARVA